MITNAKIGVLAVVAALLVAFGAFGLGSQTAQAAPDEVWWVADYGNDADPGASLIDCEDTDTIAELDEADTLVVHTGSSVILCAEFSIDDADVSFDSNDFGEWDDAVCDGEGSIDDLCLNEVGEGTDLVQIPWEENDVTLVLITFECPATYGRTLITVDQEDEEFTFWIECRAEPASATITANPTTVEIAPARSNAWASLITVEAKDAGGNPAYAGDVLYDDERDIIEGPTGSPEVRFETTQCVIEENGVDEENGDDVLDDGSVEFEEAEGLVKSLNTANPGSYAVWNDVAQSTATATTGKVDNSNLFYVDGPDSGLVTDRTVSAAILLCGLSGQAPGKATITAIIDVAGAADIVVSTDVTVIGPPAAIVVEASPTDLTCGEKSTITVTVKDSIGQNVSDHTRVEIITNLGGVLAGTGAAAGFSLPTTPISSTAADTFGGVATAFLLTSNVHAGPYEVIATSGGTAVDDFGTPTYLGGVFSTPPVSAQVTVNCSLPAPAPAPTITAPSTGTGITPPNTGDAGLLSESASTSWTLLALVSAVVVALAGTALKVVRR